MTFSRMLIFLSIFSTIIFSIHYYVWTRLVRNAMWPAPWGKVLTIAIFTLAALVPVVFLTLRSTPRAFNAPLSWLVYVWMGFLFYFFMFSLVSDILRSGMFLTGMMPKDPDKRQLLARTFASGIALAAGAVGIGGLLNVAGGVKVKRIRVPLAKLPEGASGYSIVQLTDIHVGPTIGLGFIESIVLQTNALEPDLIAITGDMVDGSVEHLRDHVEPLRELKAKDGVYFITGNHEYYSGADEWIAHIESLGIRVLRNERVDVRGLFDLAGVDDFSAKNMLLGHGQDIAKAVEGRDISKALVLLAHQPKTVHDAVKADVDLQLSGHVHAGQMMPFNWLAHIDQPFISGLHQLNKTWIYVSAGTGYWGPPMRVGTHSEITQIELVSSGEAMG